MNELRRILRNQLRLAVGALALGCLVPLQVAAQEVADPAFNRFRSQVIGNSVNFTYGTGGTPLGGSGASTGIGVSAGVDVARPTTVNTKHGPISGTLKQKISSAAMGKGFARAFAIIGGPVGLAFLALPAIVDWMTDAGLQADSSGAITREVTNQHCRVSWANQVAFTFEASSCTAAATAVHAAQYTGPTSPTVFCIDTTPQRCGVSWTGAYPFSTEYFVTYVGDPVTSTEPVNNAEIEAAMSSVMNPTPEALAELYKLGQTMDLANPIPDLVDTLRAEFEARSPETTTTETSSTPSETKTEEKKCATYTQVVANVLSLVEQCETTTTTQAKDPVTGEPVGAPTVSTSTSSSNAPDPKAEESEEAEGLCKLFPDIAACAKLGTETLEIPRGERSVSYTVENVFGSGTCPADKTFVAYGQTLQLTNMAQACDLLDTFVKPIAILLAAFTALMIVAVGVPE